MQRAEEEKLEVEEDKLEVEEKVTRIHEIKPAYVPNEATIKQLFTVQQVLNMYVRRHAQLAVNCTGYI